MLDLSAYLRRVGHAGPVAADLATLHALSAAHVAAIPFENLDVLLGRGIDLRPEAIEAKLVHAGRGGYCFEQNTLFLHVLQAIGFVARPLSARVRMGRERHETPPRTHVFVRVELEGESWLADVGVGGLSLTGAIRFLPDAEQATPHEPRRIVPFDGRWLHQARLGERWEDVCEFTLEEMPAIDREVASWFTSTHPDSHFRNRLVVARADGDGRRSVLNERMTRRNADGSAVVETFGSPEELRAGLAAWFGLHFPPGTTFPLRPDGRIVAA